MLLGIDVGGTHTDGVVIDQKGIAATYKVPTDHQNLMASIRAVLERVCADVQACGVERLNLSTTLTTNAIVEAKTETVGMLVCAGPGIDPASFQICPDYHVIPGSMDHRGHVQQPPDEAALARAVASCASKGIRAYAVVGKFSPRNPDHEQRMAQACAPHADVTSFGHAISGRLNFPRRITSAYFNAATWRTFNGFADAVAASLEQLGMSDARVNILKADGGTMPLSAARQMPVESILSGPAASVMGIISMCDIALDSIILDVGGTTTDIAVFAQGSPLMEMDGIDIGSYPTLVRALKCVSIGVGGDSALRVQDGEVFVGPRRLGPAMADGGTAPALTDALNVAGEAAHGDVDASRRGLTELGAPHGLDAETLARMAVERGVGAIVTATREMLAEINARPVYTIHELLEERQIVPRKVYVMGGPAKALRMPLFRAFQLSVSVPEHFAVANAVGAALTRTTRSAELFADTSARTMAIPSLGVSRIVEPGYDLEAAQRDAARHLLASLRHEGIPSREENVQITHASSFAMVEDGKRLGRNIRVVAQIKPGILHRYRELRGRLC